MNLDKPASIRCLLLDLDNTAYSYSPCHESGLRSAHAEARGLFDSFEAFAAAYRSARASAKSLVSGTAAEHCRFLYFKRMLEQLCGASNVRDTMRIHGAYWHGYESAMALDPGCRELLLELRGRGVRTAWVTNFTTQRQFMKLVRLGVEELVDMVVTSEEAGAEKPSPRSLLVALERLGIPPGPDVVMVGDSVADDGAASEAAGVRFILLDRDGEVPGAAHSVRSWGELRKALD